MYCSFEGLRRGEVILRVVDADIMHRFKIYLKLVYNRLKQVLNLLIK